jgi:hypothetical protein
MSCGPVVWVTLRYETVCSLRWWLASFAGSTLLLANIDRPGADALAIGGGLALRIDRRRAESTAAFRAPSHQADVPPPPRMEA